MLLKCLGEQVASRASRPSRRIQAPALPVPNSGCRPSSCSIWPLVCPPLVVPETDGLACTQRRNHLDKCGFQCSVVFFRLRRPPARWPTKVMLKDCQETESLHLAGLVVVQLGRVVGYCVGMKSCGLRRHGNEPLACCQAYAMCARRATQSNARREPRAVLLSSVCNVCPRGDQSERETAVTCDPAGRLLGVASVSAFTPP